MHLKINGHNLHLKDRGNSDGLPLVFLHSWAGSTHSWKYVVAALPNRLRPITIDQRGWGRSESHSSGFQLADLASDAKEVVKAHLSQIEPIDKHVDNANRVALVNEIIEAFRQ